MTNSFENNTDSKFNDCLSCRIWAGTFHIGAAGFVASHWRKQPNRASQAFVIIFSTALATIGFTRLFNLPPFSNLSMKQHTLQSTNTSENQSN